MAIECYEDTCKYHNGTEPFCDLNECLNPPMVDCPFCGKKIPEGTAEAPADYCHHE